MVSALLGSGPQLRNVILHHAVLLACCQSVNRRSSGRTTMRQGTKHAPAAMRMPAPWMMHTSLTSAEGSIVVNASPCRTRKQTKCHPGADCDRVALATAYRRLVPEFDGLCVGGDELAAGVVELDVHNGQAVAVVLGQQRRRRTQVVQQHVACACVCA